MEVGCPLVEQQADIAQAVDVLVEVDVGILEGVVGRARRVYATDARMLVDGALFIEDVVFDVIKCRNVAALACGEINHHPNSAGVAYRIAVGVGDFDIALREMAVVVLHPGRECIGFVDFRPSCHLYRHSR